MERRNVRTLVPECQKSRCQALVSIRAPISVAFGKTTPDMPRMRRPAIQWIGYPRNAYSVISTNVVLSEPIQLYGEREV